jgi:hypothetical protein
MEIELFYIHSDQRAHSQGGLMDPEIVELAAQSPFVPEHSGFAVFRHLPDLTSFFQLGVDFPTSSVHAS